MTDWHDILIAVIIIGGILAFIGIIAYSSYIQQKMQYENFQKTIMGLSDEQKCLHICGFQYPGNLYLENYKFCIEKCDRISERKQQTC